MGTSCRAKLQLGYECGAEHTNQSPLRIDTRRADPRSSGRAPAPMDVVRAGTLAHFLRLYATERLKLEAVRHGA